MKPENFQPESVSTRPNDALARTILPIASEHYVDARKQIEAQSKTTAVHSPGVAQMLNGFTIDSSSESKQECKTGYASFYHPTGSATADGSVYTANNRLKAAAVDNKEPMGNGHVWLGSKLHVKSLADGTQAIDVTVRDTGGFGRLQTPEAEKPRLIDLTDAAFEALRGDKTKGLLPVEVCYQSEEIRHHAHHRK